ncbi:helicase-associated domain-containing protein [Cohnella soli]|uniref:Helicase-associated domain-containing protein n=1 Tax=Cohnella soli TaxID=425005 RepID=A0ABW0HLB5_9BACL
MNVEQSLERLPESAIKLIGNDPAVRSRYANGEKLAVILRSGTWARSWLAGSDERERLVLRGLMRHYGSKPFETETLVRLLVRDLPLAGAEVKLAIARLRRSGILFAIRKAWGDKLVYLPSDAVALWQPLLLPAWGEETREEMLVASDVRILTEAYQPPLSVQLIAVWHALIGQPLGWTAKGNLHQQTVAKLNGLPHFGIRVLACLPIVYPHADQLGANTALAIDIGMRLGLTGKVRDRIHLIEGPRLREWLEMTPGEADLKLYELVSTVYAMGDSGLQLASSFVRSLPAGVWIVQKRLEVYGCTSKLEDWILLLEAFGWAERGESDEGSAFRLLADFSLSDTSSALASPIESDLQAKDLFIYVQPDGEVIVPPGAPLKYRWLLREIADVVAEDALSLYKLSKATCERAYNAGYTLARVVSALVEGSGGPLPESVSNALKDWFGMFGKAIIDEAVVLLRTEDGQVAKALLRDGEVADMIKERLTETIFVVDESALPTLRTRLRKLGFPAPERWETVQAEDGGGRCDGILGPATKQGWASLPHDLSVFEPDVIWPANDDMFPGLGDIPASWIAKPRIYHVSTKRQLLEQAIAWETPVYIGREGRSGTFLPSGAIDGEGGWAVSGRWRTEEGDEVEPAVIRSGDIGELMIDLPALQVAEPLATESD